MVRLLPTVYVLDPIHPLALEKLAAGAQVVTWTDAGVHRWPEAADAIIVRTAKVSADVLSRTQRLKIVSKHGVGVDNIDIEAAKKHGVHVSNTPGTNVEAVAELTLGLALSLARKVCAADTGLRSGHLPSHSDLQGLEFLGKRLGILGLGQIGRRVAEIFRAAFGMEIWGYDPYLSDEQWEALGIRPVAEVSDLFPQVDLVTLHLPLTQETRGMIGGEELKQFLPTAFLVNVARGGIVDETALYEALQAGALKGAAMDVFVDEPPSADHPLLSLPQFLATPHLGAMTEESMVRMGTAAVEHVLTELAGTPAPHRIA